MVSGCYGALTAAATATSPLTPASTYPFVSNTYHLTYIYTYKKFPFPFYAIFSSYERESYVDDGYDVAATAIVDDDRAGNRMELPCHHCLPHSLLALKCAHKQLRTPKSSQT